MRQLIIIGFLFLSIQSFGQINTFPSEKEDLIAHSLALFPIAGIDTAAVTPTTLKFYTTLYQKENLKDVDDIGDIFAQQTMINPMGIVAIKIDSTITTQKETEIIHKREWPKGIWVKVNKIGLDLNEVAFVNWNSGGSNSISALLGLAFKRNYSTPNLHWNTNLLVEYGINKQKDLDLRKTDDNIELNSTFGYKPDSLSNWYYSAKFNFNTQLTNGYKYPDKDNAISEFMAPAYLFLGVGSEYKLKEKSLELYISPLTMKSTFVLDQRLANTGAFGVEKAIYDENGVLIKEGKRSRQQVGILVTNEYHTEIFKNIILNNKLSLYTDYINDFGNIDINWELNFRFRVNEFVVAKLGSHLKYDDDISTKHKDENGDTYEEGPSVQWKQHLGIGVIVNL